jgi:hypothetical protein
MGGGSSSARADAVRATLVDAAQMDRIERLLLDADESATDDLRSGRTHAQHRTAQHRTAPHSAAPHRTAQRSIATIQRQRSVGVDWCIERPG